MHAFCVEKDVKNNPKLQLHSIESTLDVEMCVV